MGVPVRSAAMNVIQRMVYKGASGVDVIVSGKLRQQTAKSMKYKYGFMIHSGQPKITYLSTAIRHIELRTGIMGIKVKIMLPCKGYIKKKSWVIDKKPLPDIIKIIDDIKNLI